MIVNKEKTSTNPLSKELPVHAVQRNLVPQQIMKAPKPAQPEQLTVERMDEPPPYARNSAGSVSASGLLQPSAHSPPPPSRPARLSIEHRNSTNHLYVKTRHDPITGMYHVDPDIGTVALGKEGISAQERKRYNQKHQQRHRHHGRKGFFKRVELPEPNAIFETRQGDITLDLGVTASPGTSKSRARIQAATRQGSVSINVLGVHVRRHINMEISTRSGNVHILIPRTFSGYIQLHSRHGNLITLPRFTSAMQLVYRRDTEMQLVVGRATEASSPEKASTWTGDTIHVSTRHGNVKIGFLGEDVVPPDEPGFWKKLTDFFKE